MVIDDLNIERVAPLKPETHTPPTNDWIVGHIINKLFTIVKWGWNPTQPASQA